MRILSLLFLGTFLLTLTYGQNTKQADSLYKAAINKLKKDTALVDKKLMQECIGDLTNAIIEKPRFWKAYEERATLYWATKQYNQAFEDMTINLKPNEKKLAMVELHKTRALEYFEDKNYDKAIEDWTFILTNLSSKEKGFILLYRAKAHWLKGETKLACQDYKSATKIDASLSEIKEFIKCD
jgi:tetratricopeptide (TPR) repeat protein